MLVFGNPLFLFVTILPGGGGYPENNLISRPGSKVLGSPELIFFGFKQSLQNILLKFVSQVLKFSQNQQKLGFENSNVFQK